MNLILQGLLKGREHWYPHNLEDNASRVFASIMELWGTPEFEPFLSQLYLDGGRNERQGFPPDIMAEIFFLNQLHDLAMKAKVKENYVWCDEKVRLGLNEEQIEYSPAGFFNALDKGNLRAVRLFLEAGVDIELTNYVGWTPLMVAAFLGNIELVTLLLTAGASVNARDNKGCCPIHWSSLKGFSQVTELLVVNGANVNEKSDKGLTPLLQAATGGNADTVSYLLSNNAMVHEADEEGWSPLHRAVANGFIDVVGQLIAAGADPYCKHASGFTPVDIAVEKIDTDMMRKLVKRR